MPQRAVAGICCRALPLAFVLLDAVLVAPTPRPATATNPAALAHKQPRRSAGLRTGRDGAGGDNNTTAVGGGRPRGHTRPGNINTVSTGDRSDNQARSGEAQVSNIDKDPEGESTPSNHLRSRCDESAFETCAALGEHNYIQQCCQGSCAYGYDNCYFCPAPGTGGPHCFNLAASRETACLASSNCAASSSSSSPSPAPSSGTRYASADARTTVSFAA